MVLLLCHDPHPSSSCPTQCWAILHASASTARTHPYSPGTLHSPTPSCSDTTPTSTSTGASKVPASCKRVFAPARCACDARVTRLPRHLPP